MDWKEWVAWKEKRYIVVILFVIAYVLTIPTRNYDFLTGFIDTTQGVPMVVHLVIIIVGLIILMALIKLIEMIVKYFLKK